MMNAVAAAQSQRQFSEVDEAEVCRFVQKLLKHMELLLGLSGIFSISEGITMILQNMSGSCLGFEWNQSRNSNRAFTDKVNLLICTRFLELPHGYGLLFSSDHWQV